MSVTGDGERERIPKKIYDAVRDQYRSIISYSVPKSS